MENVAETTAPQVPAEGGKASSGSATKAIILAICSGLALVCAIALGVVLLLNMNKESTDAATAAKAFVQSIADEKYDKTISMLKDSNKVTAEKIKKKADKSDFYLSVRNSETTLTVSDPVYSEEETNEAKVTAVVTKDGKIVESKTFKLVNIDDTWCVDASF